MKFIVISIPTNAHRRSINFILKLLRHVSMLIHHCQGAYKFCQLQLLIIELIKYSIAVFYLVYLLLYCILSFQQS